MEEWRVYKLNPNYIVSTNGDVARVSDGLILKKYKQKSGYVYVWLDEGNYKHSVPLHKIVCYTFHGEEGYIKGLFVDHINTIRDDNRACNLRWVTPKENANNETTKLNRKKHKMRSRKTSHP